MPIKLIAIISDGGASEPELKKLLAPWKLEGEWFLPRPELQAWLDAALENNRLLRRVVPDKEFVVAHILPLMRAYLGGREPNNNSLGDLAIRVLAGKLDDPIPRARHLFEATKGRISHELCMGYLPATERAVISLPRDLDPIVLPNRTANVSLVIPPAGDAA